MKMTKKQWLNQKIANFFRDFKQERDPHDDPRTIRAVCRIFFLVILVTSFSLTFIHFWTHSPDFRAKQLYLDENHNPTYPNVSLYDHENYTWMNNANLSAFNFSDVVIQAKRGLVPICPCTSNVFSWREYLNFYILTENLSEWNIELRNGTSSDSSPFIYVPNIYNKTLAQKLFGHIWKDETPMDTVKFCNITYMWPYNLSESIDSKPGLNTTRYCILLARALFPMKGVDPMEADRSSILDSPNLLSREAFNMVVVKRARESVLTSKLFNDMQVADLDLWQYGNSLCLFLFNALEGYDIPEWWSLYYLALRQSTVLQNLVHTGKTNPSVMLLQSNGTMNRSLHMEIDWHKYYKACDPKFCQVTLGMNNLRQVSNTFALLGGVMNLMLGLVTILLWPATAYVLTRCCKNSETDQKKSGKPETGDTSKGSLLSSKAPRSDDGDKSNALKRVKSKGREAQSAEDP